MPMEIKQTKYGENAPVSKALSEKDLSSVCETERVCVIKKQI